MLRRTHVTPFVRATGDSLVVEFLHDSQGRVVGLLDELCQLVEELKGQPQHIVSKALKQHEEGVRDSRRLAGVARSLADRCRFEPPEGADRSAQIRQTLFDLRGSHWPPIPGDRDDLFTVVGKEMGLKPSEVDRLLYGDDPAEAVLVRVPKFDGAGLLEHYNLDLARGVLLDAESVRVSARGGWRDIFRAVKLARLMYRVERRGKRRYMAELTGPAAPFIRRGRRYGSRFARVVPALTRASGWRIEARILRDGRQFEYQMDGRGPFGVTGARRRKTYDSEWERSLADEFRQKIGGTRGGWALEREDTPVALGEELFLPDFTLRHADGREALVELMGFWTPEYLKQKIAKIKAAGLTNLILVVYDALAVSEIEVPDAAIVRFSARPRIEPVMAAAEKLATMASNRRR